MGMGNKDEEDLIKTKDPKVKKRKKNGQGKSDSPYKDREMYPLKRLFNGKRFKDLKGKELRKLNKKRKAISVKEWKREVYMSKKKIDKTIGRK